MSHASAPPQPRRARAPRARVLAAFLLLTLSATAHAAVPDFGLPGQWLEVRGKNAVVMTDAGEAAGVGMARKIDRLCDVFARIYPKLHSAPALPLQVLLLRDEDEMESYRPAEMEQLAGYFTPGMDQLFIVLNGNAEGEDPSMVLYHEFVHAHQYGNFAGLPLWIKEGMAEYFSTMRIARSSVEVGKPVPNLVAWLGKQQWIEPSMLFSIDIGDPAYQKDNPLRTTFYAESWALVHYLRTGDPERVQKFANVLETLHTGAQPRPTFEAQFPPATWPGLLSEVQSHLEKIGSVELSRWQFDKPIDAVDAVPVPLERAEVLYRLGKLLLALGPERRADAAQHFQAALVANPNHAPSLAGLAYTQDAAGEAAKAERGYQRAMVLAPSDPRPFFLAGRGALERYSRSAKETPQGEAVVRVARERFARCLKLDPDDTAALGCYGTTFVHDSLLDSTAITSLERAVARVPGRPDFAAALAYLHARSGRKEDAQALVRQGFAPGMGQSEIEKLEHAIESVELGRARDLFRAGRRAEAESLLAKTAIESRDTQVRATAAKELADLQAHDRNQRAGDLYNLGVAAMGRDDPKEGLAKFEQARPLASDPELIRLIEKNSTLCRAHLAFRHAVDLMTKHQIAAAKRELAAFDGVTLPDELRKPFTTLAADANAMQAIERSLALIEEKKLDAARASLQKIAGTPMSQYLRDDVRQRIEKLDQAIARTTRPR